VVYGRWQRLRPRGGQNLAPRQQEREWKGNRKRSDAQAARQVREYRDRYPGKAILWSFDQGDPWAVLAAGGSIPNLPRQVDPRLLSALPRMQPFAPAGLTDRQWALAEPGRHYLVYSSSGEKIRLDLSADPATFTSRWIDRKTGRFADTAETVQGGRTVEVPVPDAAPVMLWLSQDVGNRTHSSPE
jgi:hypothetical protein